MLSLLVKCDNIHMRTTHFTKFYLLNCLLTDQLPSHKDAFQVIATELNKTDNNISRSGGDRKVLVDQACYQTI
ncbi:hypothetical protein HDU92_000996 [Lobulomyces angularis]|nr:hypothetical protein HDU92_000996 [Lobulomyces angularis]